MTPAASTPSSSHSAVQEVLVDAFGRIREVFADVCDGLSAEDAAHRPTPDANSIAWTLWHLTRIQDDHVCGITGDEQVWMADGWYDRFGLPFAPEEHGYGHSAEQVAAVQVETALLDDYHGGRARSHHRLRRHRRTRTSWRAWSTRPGTRPSQPVCGWSA